MILDSHFAINVEALPKGIESFMNRGNSVINGLDDWGSIPGRVISSSLCVQTDSGAHPASYLMGTGGPFLEGKARPGGDAGHSPPSSVEVKNE
jgi:hypothetical protein